MVSWEKVTEQLRGEALLHKRSEEDLGDLRSIFSVIPKKY